MKKACIICASFLNRNLIALIFSIVFITMNNSLSCQTMNVEETLLYLNRKFQEFPHKDLQRTTTYHISISPIGELIVVDNEVEKALTSLDKTRYNKTIYKSKHPAVCILR